MPLYRIYAGKQNSPLELVCIREFKTQEQADQFAFDSALDKCFPYLYVENVSQANTYLNALYMIDYRAEEI